MSVIQNLSLFIPRVFSNIDEERIADKFEEMNVGKVSSVDLVPQYGKNYNAVYVHFEYWNNNEVALNLQSSILDPAKEARVVYDAPWFWIVLENKGRKQVTNTQRKSCIDLTDFAETIPVVEEKMPVKGKSYKNVVVSNLPSEVEDSYDEWEEIVEYNDGEQEYEDEKQEYTDEDFENMEELEDMMNEEEAFQVSVDWRYLKTIEEENLRMGQSQYEIVGLKNQLASVHQFYIDGILKHLPVGAAIELRKKMGF
jgi:hypothetical protein